MKQAPSCNRIPVKRNGAVSNETAPFCVSEERIEKREERREKVSALPTDQMICGQMLSAPTVYNTRTVHPCHSEPVRTLAWESVFLRCEASRRLRWQGLRIATGVNALAMTGSCPYGLYHTFSSPTVGDGFPVPYCKTGVFLRSERACCFKQHARFKA